MLTKGKSKSAGDLPIVHIDYYRLLFITIFQS